MTELYARDLELINPDLLPPQIRLFIRTIGIANTLRLLEARGGLPTHMPADPDKTSVFHKILSHADIQALADTFGGSIIDIPKADKILRQLRNQYVVNALRNGHKTGRELARELGLTYRMIKIIRAESEMDMDDATGDLFALDNSADPAQAR